MPFTGEWIRGMDWQRARAREREGEGEGEVERPQNGIVHSSVELSATKVFRRAHSVSYTPFIS